MTAAMVSLMDRALAISSAEQPHPNPRVGAVVLSAEGEIVGEGAHIAAGQAHAEVIALTEAGSRAVGGTAIVTLEPCAHDGRTPPCTDALLDAGVARVIVGAVDPDHRVAGSGIAALRRAGVEVVGPVRQAEVEANDPAYFHHRRTGRPLVTLKLATTLDGATAAADGTSRWISGVEARRDGHRLRAEADVVIAGAGTVLGDDPRLDVRLDGYAGRQPRPVVVAGRRTLDPSAAVFSRGALVYAPHHIGFGAECVELPDGEKVDLYRMILDLGSRGYVAALVEGGATLAADLVRADLVDRIVFYLAGKLALGTGLGVFAGVFATIADAKPVDIVEVSRLGDDLRVTVSMADAEGTVRR